MQNKQTLGRATVFFLMSLSPCDVLFAQESVTPKILQVQGAKIEYLEQGAGEPVIFIHGAFSDRRAWSDIQKEMSASHRAISYTRRFYGADPHIDGEQVYDQGVHAEDLAQLIRSIDAGPVHLVTWSSGAYSASIVAAENPDLVKSMVHYEPITTSAIMKDVPHYQAASDEWDSRWEGVSAQIEAGDLRHAMRKAIEVVFELPAGGFASLSESLQTMFLDNAHTIPILFSGDSTIKTDCDYVGNIGVPTLVILGTLTHRAFAMEVERMDQCMPNSTLKIIAGVNHAGPAQTRDPVIKLIADHIEEHQ